MLNKIAIRLATVRALRGKTLAGDNVIDSEYGAIDEMAGDKPKPFIIVYTDDAQYAVTGRDLYGTGGSDRVDSGTQKLVIEIGLTQRMKVDEDKDGNPIVEAVAPVTDAAMELNIDIIERQIMDALTDPRSDAKWAEMWRRFVSAIKNKDVQRGASARDGVRFAGRQITLSVQLHKDPPAGETVRPLWADFLALAATDPTLALVLPVIEAVLTGNELNDYEMVRAAYGLTEREARALQINLDDGHDADPVIAQIDHQINTAGVGFDIDTEGLT